MTVRAPVGRLLYTRCGVEALIVRVDERSGAAPAIGATLQVAAQEGCLHRFDAGSGHRLP